MVKWTTGAIFYQNLLKIALVAIESILTPGLNGYKYPPILQ